jgi:hypothetical protein
VGDPWRVLERVLHDGGVWRVLEMVLCVGDLWRIQNISIIRFILFRILVRRMLGGLSLITCLMLEMLRPAEVTAHLSHLILSFL